MIGLIRTNLESYKCNSTYKNCLGLETLNDVLIRLILLLLCKILTPDLLTITYLPQVTGEGEVWNASPRSTIQLYYNTTHYLYMSLVTAVPFSQENPANGMLFGGNTGAKAISTMQHIVHQSPQMKQVISCCYHTSPSFS